MADSSAENWELLAFWGQIIRTILKAIILVGSTFFAYYGSSCNPREREEPNHWAWGCVGFMFMGLTLLIIWSDLCETVQKIAEHSKREDQNGQT